VDVQIKGTVNMSNTNFKIMISKFHLKLNQLVEIVNYDIHREEVQALSKRVDRLLILYDKQLRRNKKQ
jgi:hypothetical protein